jgi:hypothetical protein
VNADRALLKGSATALVAIVKLEDVHCPLCRQVQRTLEQLLARYASKLSSSIGTSQSTAYPPTSSSKGRMRTGAPSSASFVRVVEEELARAQ